MSKKLELPQEYPLVLNNVTYTIGKKVGRGGSSIVYHAECKDDSEPVLIKELCPKNIPGIERDQYMTLIIPPRYQSLWEDYVYRAEFEHKILSELRIDIDDEKGNTVDNWFKKYNKPVRVSNNAIYTVIQANSGDMLDDMMNEQNKCKHFKDFVAVCDCILSLLDALEPMHNKGYLHLDVAPDNIHFLKMDVGKRRVAQMIDFNSAYKIGTTEQKNRRFSTKNGYSAYELEISRGTADTKAKDLTPATDLYSVTAIFFELLTGRLPEPIDLTRFSRNELVIDNESDYLGGLDNVIVQQVNDFIKKGLSVSNRFASVAEMRDSINALIRLTKKIPVQKELSNSISSVVSQGLGIPQDVAFLENRLHGNRRSSHKLNETNEHEIEIDVANIAAIPDGILYGDPYGRDISSQRATIPSVPIAASKIHIDPKSLIAFGNTDEFSDKVEDILRHGKIDQIKACLLDDTKKIVILHGADGIGKSRLIRQFLIKHKEAYQNFCRFRLNDIIDYKDVNNCELFPRILDQIPPSINVRTRSADNSPIEAERRLFLNALKQLDENTLLVIENANHISHTFVDEIQKHNICCRIILSTSEPCDFLHDSDFCTRVPIAFDPETEFASMDCIFLETLKNDSAKEILSEPTRKRFYHELEYNTQIIVFVAKMLNSSKDTEKIIALILASKISSIEEKVRDERVTRYTSLFQFVSELVLNININDDDELRALYLIALLGRRKLKYSTLQQYYDVSRVDFLSLHDKGIITFDEQNDTISISSMLIQVYYEKIRVLADSTAIDLCNTVAKGLIKEYTLRNCSTFADAQNAIDSFAYGVNRLNNNDAHSPIDAIITLVKSSVPLADDVKINMITNMAELYNALGKKDDSYKILKSIDSMNLDILSENRVLYLNVLKNKYHLGRLLFSVDNIDESISLFEEISNKLEPIDDDQNWQLKGNVFLSLIGLYEIKGNDNKYIETAEKAIKYYNSKEQYYGSILVLATLLRGPAISRNKGRELLKLVKKAVYSMTSNNSIEVATIFSLSMFKKMFELNLRSSINYDYMENHLLRHGIMIAGLKMLFPLKKMKSKLDLNDASGAFFRHIYFDEELTPKEVTESTWALFLEVAEKFENLHLSYGLASAFQDFVNYISRSWSQVIELDKELAYDKIFERMDYELKNYRTQLLLTNMDIARIKGELYRYFTNSLGISKALGYLEKYEIEVRSIPHNYVINRVESFENLGDLYKMLANKELDDEVKNRIDNSNTELSTFKSHLESKAEDCFLVASLLVPKSHIKTWARIKYKAGEYQEVYDELKREKIYSCNFCNCCYQLAQEAIKSDDEKLYIKYLKDIFKTSKKLFYCKRNECFFIMGNNLIALYQRTEREDAKRTLYITFAYRFILYGYDKIHNKKGGFVDSSGVAYKGRFKKGRPFGKGVLTWPNGNKYEGDFVDGQQTGKGVFTWPNGNKYEGDFVNGQRTGTGVIEGSNGNTYEGDFVNGQFTGKGVFSWADGAKYEGDHVDGQRTGKGVFTYSNGNKYKGDFVNGQRTGKGVYTYTNGDKYEGSFVNGNSSGRGVFSWPNGNKFKGEWLDGKRKGVFTWANGNKYIGDFVGWQRTGKGVFKWPSGSKYKGDFVNGQQTGKGIFTYSNGDKYEGSFVNGKFSGRGVFTWPNGNKFKGEWLDGKRIGKGVYTWANGDKYMGDYVGWQRTGKGVFKRPSGSKYKGDFVNGQQTGKGIFTYSNGNKYEGSFVNGKFAGKGVFTWANDDKYDGEWLDGRRHGQGSMAYADGRSSQIGEWQNDKFIEPQEN